MPNENSGRGYPLPHPDNIAREDATRIRNALLKVDDDVVALRTEDARKDNPHATTAAQVGAYTKAQMDTITDALNIILSQKANAANAALTGTPTAPTAALGTDSQQIATMAALKAMRSDLVGGAGPALDQLGELAAALNNDKDYAATVTAALAGKQPLDADLTAIAALVTTALGRSLLTVADAAAARTAIGAQANLGYTPQANLGFTPVRQGGGAGQAPNTIYIGWDGVGLRAQVDGSDLGRLWTAYNAPQSAGNPFYFKLPSGLIIQGGLYSGVGDQAWLAYPMAFSNLGVPTLIADNGYASDGGTINTMVANVAASGFSAIRQYVSPDAGFTGAWTFHWMAIGF